MPLLNPKQLHNLKSYKPGGADNSITLKYVLKPFYEWAIEFFPMNIAPNTITLVGLCMHILSFLLCLVYSPTLTERLPRWLFLVNGMCIFLYQTLDNLDGKQARRTKASSPLGELFDHGVDALVCTLGIFMWACMIRAGVSVFTFLALLSAYLPFVSATWEEYYRGGIFLGPINGPIEGLLTMAGVQIFTFFVGQDFWQISVLGLLNLGQIATITSTVVMGLSTIPNFVNTNKEIEKSKISFSSAYMQLVPAYSVLLFGFVWFFTSPADIATLYPRSFFVAVGVNCAYIISNLTLAFLLKDKYRTTYKTNLFLGVCAVNSVLGAVTGASLIPETLLLFVYLGSVLVSYCTFVYQVVTEISTYLGIQVFCLDYLKQ